MSASLGPVGSALGGGGGGGGGGSGSGSGSGSGLGSGFGSTFGAGSGLGAARIASGDQTSTSKLAGVASLRQETPHVNAPISTT